MSAGIATTPSRGGVQKKYIPFNHDPKNVGSRTGRPMPDHIPRDPQGFEDIDAFFDSPERDESTRSGLTSAVTEGDTRRTIATSIAASSVRTDFQASGRTTVAGSKRILSIMADDDDDEDEDEQGNHTAGNIIDQEEGVNFRDDSGSRSMDIVTPSKSFGRSKRHRPPHSTSPGQTLSLSQLHDQEEDVYPAALASNPRTNGRLQPRVDILLGSPSRRLLPNRKSPSHRNEHADDDATMTRRQSPPTPATERTQRTTSRTERQDSPRRADQEDSPNGVETSRNASNDRNRASNAGVSKASRYSLAAPSTAGGDDVEDDLELDVQYDDEVDESLIQQPEMSSPVLPTKRLDHQASNQREEDSPGPQDDYPDPAGLDGADIDGQDPEAIQQEEDDDEQAGEDEAPPRATAKKGKSKADTKNGTTTNRRPLGDATNKRKTKAPRRDPDDESESGGDAGHARKRSRSAKVQREPVHKPADEGGVSYLRTARERHKPLDWWRGERPVIKRQIVNGEVGPAFITAEWLTIPEEKATPLAAKRKGAARRARSGTAEAAPKKKTKQRRQGSEDDDDAAEPAADDVTGWDEGTEPGGMVMDYTTGEEVMRRVANTSAMVRPKEIPNATFTYQKIFGEDEFFAAGILRIEVGGCKAPKNSRDNAYVFFVQQGCVEVTIHRTRFLMSEGGAFLIPRGNQYGFSNVCQKEVQLCFSQARRIKAEEDLPNDETLNNNQTTMHQQNDNSTRYNNQAEGESARTAAQDDDDEEEDSPPPVQRKRPVAKKTTKR
ncbi:mitotic fidelity of chromosome transmission- protein [Naganishia albida]|nr:mitotic fidelity of chromosome transmission- protein [Naganishia albida]